MPDIQENPHRLYFRETTSGCIDFDSAEELQEFLAAHPLKQEEPFHREWKHYTKIMEEVEWHKGDLEVLRLNPETQQFESLGHV
jgi:hypothetical protein